LNFLDRLSKYPQISNFTKICPVGAELFHVKRQTDRHDKAIIAFPNFAKTPKNDTMLGKSIPDIV
jgi:hypothetical protein